MLAGLVSSEVSLLERRLEDGCLLMCLHMVFLDACLSPLLIMTPGSQD